MNEQRRELVLAIVGANVMNIENFDEDNVIDSLDFDILTQENIFTDAAESVGRGLLGAVKFLKHVVTLDMKNYYDSINVTGIEHNLLVAKRKVSRIGEIDFNEFGEKLILVPPYYGVRQKNFVDLLEKNMTQGVSNTLDIIKEFDAYVGEIISSPDAKSRQNLIDGYKTRASELDKKQKSIDKSLTNMLGKPDSEHRINELVTNLDELHENCHRLFKLFDYVNEKDMKHILKATRNLNNRLLALEDLANSGELSKDVVKQLVEHITALANTITVVGKLYATLFEVSQIQISITTEL